MGEFLSSFGEWRFVAWIFCTLSVCVVLIWRRQKHLKDQVAQITAQVLKEHGNKPFKRATDIADEGERRSKEGRFFANIKYSIIALVAIVVITYIAFFVLRLPVSSSPAEWGQMGDFFGGMLNPILAFASFIALLYTIRIQSEELRLTTKELANNVEVQKDIVKQHKTNLLQSKANNKVSFAAPMLNAKIKEADELLLTFDGEKGDLSPIPTLFALYQAAFKSAHYAPAVNGQMKRKDCRSVQTDFQSRIKDYDKRYKTSFDYSLNVLQRVLSTANFYIVQLNDDEDIDEFYLRSFKIELQRPAAILYLAGKVEWNTYSQIDMAAFMEGQLISDYPTT